MINIPLSEVYVAVTDILLSLLCFYFSFFSIDKNSKLLFFSLAVSSLFGSIYHLFFPGRLESLGGNFIWLIVCLGILITSWCLLRIIAGLLNFTNLKILSFLFIFLSLCSLYMIFFINGKFYNLLLMYLPIILTLAIVSLLQKKWGIFLASTLAILAGLVQVFHFSLGNNDIFTFNTNYHVIQGLSLYMFYKSLKNK